MIRVYKQMFKKIMLNSSCYNKEMYMPTLQANGFRRRMLSSGF